MLAMMDEVGGLILANLPELMNLTTKLDQVQEALATVSSKYPEEVEPRKKTLVQSIKDMISSVTMYAIANPQRTEEFVVKRVKDFVVNASNFATDHPEEAEKMKGKVEELVQVLPIRVKSMVSSQPEPTQVLEGVNQFIMGLQDQMWEFAMDHPESTKEAMFYVVKCVKDIQKELKPVMSAYSDKHPAEKDRWQQILQQSGKHVVGNVSSYLREHLDDLQDLQDLSLQRRFAEKLYNFADAHPEAMKSVVQYVLDQGEAAINNLDEWMTSNPEYAQQVTDYVTELRAIVAEELPDSAKIDDLAAQQTQLFLDLLKKYSKENPKEMKAMAKVVEEKLKKLADAHPEEAKLLESALVDAIPLEEEARD
eukprot:gnl/TRDRNA2_/TRDRNA2_136010_c0_seq2.p1 gnl/TRDRNA2_/TRDRNA2_136010_c0~~gnl/TRDRNA2_/TRDRNA2_136010_c0_seq2.p1  ORF type:complete len:366 (+),score=89.66 gnl/TRDRNA2_/TRDRNA2_136010_c0_seq2:170-1267(+)